MKLDLRPMLRGERDRIAVNFTLPPEDIGTAVIDGDIEIQGEIIDTAGYMRLTLDIFFDYHGICARCLAPLNSEFKTEFVRTVVDTGTLSEEQLEENADEYVVIQNGMLDIDEQLREALILEFPMRLLCSEDCLGLCPKCGKPKRDGDCGCDLTERDPRWDALKQFNKKEK